jgi:L-iditol 2-dehydrogenase
MKYKSYIFLGGIKMKVSIFNGNDFEIAEMEKPQITEKELLLKLIVCGLCGTDVQKAVNKEAKPGAVIGHEFVGQVVEVGKNVSKFKLGDRLTGSVHVPCFTCHECQRGHTTLCKEWRKVNIFPGGFSEYILIPDSLIKHTMYKVPDNVSSNEATLAEPIACCLRAQRAVNPYPGDTVLVMGAGTIGIIHSSLAKINKARKVIISDISDRKLKMAAEIGADVTINSSRQSLKEELLKETDGFGPDIIYICSNAPQLFKEALSLVRRGGTVCAFAPTNNREVTIDALRFFSDEIRVLGTYSLTPIEMNEAILLLEQHRIPTEKFITHSFKLSEINEAIELFNSPISKKCALKIIITAEV